MNKKKNLDKQNESTDRFIARKEDKFILIFVWYLVKVRKLRTR